MKKYISVLAGALTLASPAIGQTPTYDADTVKAECSAEWGTEYDMVKYCMDERSRGFRTYQSTLETADAAILPSLKRCEREWPNEWDMIAYCASVQINAKAGMAHTVAGIPTEIGAEILQSCTAEWGIELDMVNYCATERAKGWRAINN